MLENGMLVVIEGPDGSGKRTQTDKLCERLTSEGYDVMQISFPNYENESSVLAKKYLAGDYTCDKPDNIQFIKQISSFYAVDRVSSFIEKDIVGKSIIDYYNEGYIILADRYTTSNALHQSANMKNKDHLSEYLCWLEELEYFHLGLIEPNRVIFLDVDPEISISNIKKRYKGEAKEDILESLAHLQDVFDVKDQVIDFGGWIKVQCSEDGEMKNVNDIHEEIYKEVMHVMSFV